jgi:hypothetical protein
MLPATQGLKRRHNLHLSSTRCLGTHQALDVVEDARLESVLSTCAFSASTAHVWQATYCTCDMFFYQLPGSCTLLYVSHHIA